MLNETITITAYELQATYDTLYETLEWLEQYVEKVGYYPDWKRKKQLPKTITRTDINSIGSTRMKSIFSTSLFALRNLTKNKPDFLLEELETEFYKWLDGSGINADNCPSELAQCLLNISEVLKGKGDEFAKARIKEVNERIERMSKEKRREAFSGFVVAYQEPLDNEEEKAKSCEGQTYRDVNNESKFGGSLDRGKGIFKLIKEKQEFQKRRETQLQELREYEETMEGIESSSSTSSSRTQQNNPQQSNSDSSYSWWTSYKGKKKQVYELEGVKNGKNADQSQKDNNNLSTSGILAIIGVVSVLSIGSVAVVKNNLRKKGKKQV